VISGKNVSDHLPLSIVLNWSATNIIHSSKPTVVKHQRLRWDKTDSVSYYNPLGNLNSCRSPESEAH